MSDPLDKDDVTFTQRFLKSGGLYEGEIDGSWGTRTDDAYQRFCAEADQIASQTGRFDATSERYFLGLQLKAQLAARKFLRRLLDAGIEARVISGTRTYAEQNELFRRGRFGNPPPRITNARGGQSRHNFAIAWDIGVFRSGAYMKDEQSYRDAAAVALVDGLEWGGNWSEFIDMPHYQLVTGLSVTQTRERFEQGQPYF